MISIIRQPFRGTILPNIDEQRGGARAPSKLSGSRIRSTTAVSAGRDVFSEDYFRRLTLHRAHRWLAPEILGRLQLLAAMQNFDTFAGGATLSFTF